MIRLFDNSLFWTDFSLKLLRQKDLIRQTEKNRKSVRKPRREWRWRIGSAFGRRRSVRSIRACKSTTCAESQPHYSAQPNWHDCASTCAESAEREAAIKTTNYRHTWNDAVINAIYESFFFPRAPRGCKNRNCYRPFPTAKLMNREMGFTAIGIFGFAFLQRETCEVPQQENPKGTFQNPHIK